MLIQLTELWEYNTETDETYDPPRHKPVIINAEAIISISLTNSGVTAVTTRRDCFHVIETLSEVKELATSQLLRRKKVVL